MVSLSPELEWYFRYDPLGIYVQTAELLEVDGVRVDVGNIARRRYRCDGSSCLHMARESGERRPGLTGDCCYRAWAPVSDEERRGLLAHLPGILPLMEPEARRALESRPAARDDASLAFCSPVRVRGRTTSLRVIRHQASGHCIFRVLQREGSHQAARCAIHSYLLRAGLPLWGIKPANCWLWPLAVVPLYDGRLLLTVHAPETYAFTYESREQAWRPCLIAPPPDAPFIYQAFEAELRRVLGDTFYENLCAVIECRAAPPLAVGQPHAAARRPQGW